MLRRSPLKPGKGFVRKHEPAVPREERPMALLTPSSRRGTYSGTTAGAVPKERPVRSEAYRRLVAAMPCSDCGRPGPSQAAHPNTGKGMAMKTDDRRCFALCPDCHSAFDQGGHIPKAERRLLEYIWGTNTRGAILAAGTWPKSLPLWSEE